MDQTPIPLTHFVDFILTTGPSRIASVQAFFRPGSPLHLNFYKPVHEAITDALRGDQRPDRGEVGEAFLDAFLRERTELREKRIFPKVVTGFRKFLQRQNRMTWFEPPMRDYPLGPATVRVDPELGLLIDGRPHAVKLYWRGEPPPKPRLALMGALLHRALGPTWPGTVFSILDVRRGRLYPYRPSKDAELLLQPEALCFDAIARAL